MKETDDNIKPADIVAKNEKINILPGYPIYPASEDIYCKFKKEQILNPEEHDFFRN